MPGERRVPPADRAQPRRPSSGSSRRSGEQPPRPSRPIYPTQLEFRNGDSSLVLASRQPAASQPELEARHAHSVQRRHLQQAASRRTCCSRAKSSEITTFHSDKAVLEFDRMIETPADMNNAKLIRLELISDPEQAIPDPLKRRGMVHITNNQRSADPNRFLVLKTVGPDVLPRPEVRDRPRSLGPDVWTDAPIEIVDRSNLPRKSGTGCRRRAGRQRGESAIARWSPRSSAVSGFRRRPSPRSGLRIYLDPDETQTGAKPLAQGAGQERQAKKGSAGFSGVRRVELLEKVLAAPVGRGRAGALVGAGGKSDALPEPHRARRRGGGRSGLGRSCGSRELGRDLLQVETRGPFAYDAEKNLARFDVLPQADPNLPNDVHVTKVPARPGIQSLFSQVLEIEFNGSPTGNPPPAAPVATAGASSHSAGRAAIPETPRLDLHARPLPDRLVRRRPPGGLRAGPRSRAGGRRRRRSPAHRSTPSSSETS